LPDTREYVGTGYPDATKTFEYETPTVAFGSKEVVHVGAAVTVMVLEPNECADPMPLDAVIVNAKAPPTVGVPAMAPVFASRVTPVGRAPDVTAYVGVGKPVAAN
jgi:hypothetical protein